MSTASAFDIASLTAAIERDDPAAQAAAYAEDVTITTLNRDNGPGAPRVVHGRAALREVLDDVASRHLQHEVVRAVVDERGGALHVRCTYPDGLQVICTSTFAHAGGVITEETRLEAWDG